MVKSNLDIILDKINDRIFNAPIINQHYNDYIQEMDPDNIFKTNISYVNPESENTNKNINENTGKERETDIINCNDLSESTDLESYVASVSPPIITIDSDLFSAKKKN